MVSFGGFGIIFTSNYDDLLERALQNAGRRVRMVTQDSHIPLMRRGPDSVDIVKLYGDLNQPETIVFAREQYDTFFLKRPQMLRLLETELARSTMLYLGWSHTDPYFNVIFGELRERVGPFLRPGYAAMFDISEDRRIELERRQIRPIPIPCQEGRTEGLAQWIKGLKDMTSS